MVEEQPHGMVGVSLGLVEIKPVSDKVLNTVCMRTLLRCDLYSGPRERDEQESYTYSNTIGVPACRCEI